MALPTIRFASSTQNSTESEMIKNSKQSWSTGQAVKVGFLTLTVISALAPSGDGLPGAYILTSGSKLYSFIPHNGLTKISPDEAVELVEASNAAIAAAEARAAKKAAAVCETAAACAKLLALAA
jgi:hypothetical protein